MRNFAVIAPLKEAGDCVEGQVGNAAHWSWRAQEKKAETTSQFRPPAAQA